MDSPKAFELFAVRFVERLWNAQTPLYPKCPASFGTLVERPASAIPVECLWNASGLRRVCDNACGTSVERLWNASGTPWERPAWADGREGPGGMHEHGIAWELEGMCIPSGISN